MIKIPLYRLSMIDAQLPGYYDNCLAHGTVKQGALVIDQEVYLRLRNEYRVRMPFKTIDHWPFWARALKILAKPEDKGVGDVVGRVIGPFGGEAFKKWYKIATGKDCGCDFRQEDWNRRWPLP